VVWPQNYWDGFSCFDLKTDGGVFWFGYKIKIDGLSVVYLKTIGTAFPNLASKLVVTVSSDLASKPVVAGFLICASKLIATV
jgi:hypothetical protein